MKVTPGRADPPVPPRDGGRRAAAAPGGEELTRSGATTAAAAVPPVVLVMVKAPRRGLVKTRLGAQIGADPATQVYRLMVERQLAAVPRDWRVEVHFAPGDAGEEVRTWLGDRPRYFPQAEGDLGERLTQAVATAVDREARSVMVVGGDCPALDEACLRRAAEALQRVDVVLGPARDGGYYLIALRAAQPHLFAGIPWSTDQVLEKSLGRADSLKLSHTLLETKDDVDDLASLQRVLDEAAETNPSLRSALRSLLPPNSAGDAYPLDGDSEPAALAQRAAATPEQPSSLQTVRDGGWRGHAPVRWLLYLAAAAVVVAVGIGLDLPERLEQAVTWVGGLGPWAPVLFIALYVVATVAFLPGSVLTLGAGALFGVVWGSLLVSLASTLAATAAFLVGRYVAREAVVRRLERNARFAAIDQAVAREGWKIVALTRLSPVFPFALLNYAFGVTSVRLRDYVLASWLGMMPGTLLYVYVGAVAGAAAGGRTRSTGEWVLYAIGLLATAAVTFFVTRLARRALAQKTGS